MILKTQIKLRTDSLENWENQNSKHLALGEVGIAYQSVNTSDDPSDPFYEKKNFQIRIGRETSGTHWLSSAKLQADDFSQSFYQQLTSQLSNVFVLTSDQEQFKNELSDKFLSVWNTISTISSDVGILKDESVVPDVSSEVMYFNKIFNEQII